MNKCLVLLTLATTLAGCGDYAPKDARPTMQVTGVAKWGGYDRIVDNELQVACYRAPGGSLACVSLK